MTADKNKSHASITLHEIVFCVIRVTDFGRWLKAYLFSQWWTLNTIRCCCGVSANLAPSKCPEMHFGVFGDLQVLSYFC